MLVGPEMQTFPHALEATPRRHQSLGALLFCSSHFQQHCRSFDSSLSLFVRGQVICVAECPSATSYQTFVCQYDLQAAVDADSTGVLGLYYCATYQVRSQVAGAYARRGGVVVVGSMTTAARPLPAKHRFLKRKRCSVQRAAVCAVRAYLMPTLGLSCSANLRPGIFRRSDC